MDWPANMPFPVFYKKWQLLMAKSSGWVRAAKSLGYKQLTWEVLGELRKKSKHGAVDYVVDYLYELESMMFKYECRTFLMSAQLIDSLRETAVKAIPAELVKVPFDMIYIDFSSNPLPANNPNNERSESIRGVVVMGQSHDTHVRLCKQNGMDPNEVITGIFIEYAPGDFDGPSGIESNWTGSLGTWQAENGTYDPNVSVKRNPTVKEHGDLWALWVNSLLYINSVNADIRKEWFNKEAANRMKKTKSRNKKQAIRRHVEEGGKVFRVGHYIHIPQVSGESGGEGKGPKINVRFKVRGHWHNFWKGSNRFGNRHQELKWLAPYWKGPEKADTIHGTYSVDLNPKDKE